MSAPETTRVALLRSVNLAKTKRLKMAGLREVLEAMGLARARTIAQGRWPTVYLWYPDGIGTSKFTGALIERRLGALGTARNWNTVLKIAQALP